MKIIFQRFFVVVVCAASLSCISCAPKPSGSFRDFLRLQEAGLSEEALFQAIEHFEITHTENFESKVYLATYCMLANDTEKAQIYLERSKSVQHNASSHAESQEYVALMHGIQAYFERVQGDYDAALKSVNSALKIAEKSGKEQKLVFGFLKAQILVLQNKNDEAKNLFAKTYAEHPDRASGEDVWQMAQLETDAQKAAAFLDAYFLNGAYFAGFGEKAAKIYKQNGESAKSLLCAYTDIEYAQGYGVQLSADDVFPDGIPAVQDNSNNENATSSTAPPQISSIDDFYLWRYYLLKQKIIANTANPIDVNEYFRFERFFAHSPLYYLTAWKALRQLYPDAEENAFESVIQKAAALRAAAAY
ncbi:MAG: hypothetical protein Ta2A_25440 [Treponemataceae bacterium]|nr:MAG: hypothetical protein Ta2A_25440 [Treponemataceae bacterium]